MNDLQRRAINWILVACASVVLPILAITWWVTASAEGWRAIVPEVGLLLALVMIVFTAAVLGRRRPRPRALLIALFAAFIGVDALAAYVLHVTDEMVTLSSWKTALTAIAAVYFMRWWNRLGERDESESTV